MWEDKLKEIENEKIMYGEAINKGASDSEIHKLEQEIIIKLETTAPYEYISLLKIVNGIEFNGFIIYGVDENYLEIDPEQHINGLIEMNQIWYENEEQKKYLFLGESNIGWYVYDKESKSFKELDNPSGRECRLFDDFDSMIDNILSDSLQ